MSEPRVADCPGCGELVSFDGVAEGRKTLCIACGGVVPNPTVAAPPPRQRTWRDLLALEDGIDSTRLTDFVVKCRCGQKVRVAANECGGTKPCRRCKADVKLEGRCFHCREPTPEVLHVFKCRAFFTEQYKSDYIREGDGTKAGMWKLNATGFERVDVFVCGNCIRRRSGRAVSTWFLALLGVVLALLVLVMTVGLFVTLVFDDQPRPRGESLAGLLAGSGLVVLLFTTGSTVCLLKALPTMLYGCRTDDAVQEPIVRAYLERLYPDGTPGPRAQDGTSFGFFVTHAQRAKFDNRFSEDYAV